MTGNTKRNSRPSPDVEPESVGRASWEEPNLSFRERFHRRGRQMLVHLWGPAGSVLFHVAAIALLVGFIVSPHEKTVDEPTPIPLGPMPPAPPPLDPIAPVPGINRPASPKPVDPGIPNPGDDPHSVVDSPKEGGAPTSGTSEDTQHGINVPPVESGPHLQPGRLSGIAASPFSGRSEEGRRRAFGPSGKDPVTGAAIRPPSESAVMSALRWLKREQQPDGSWKGTSAPAMTSLALLAYLAHGELPESKEFGQTVRQALEWLIADQEADGHFRGHDGNDYTQPIAADALCEAAAMTQHPQVRQAAIKAVRLIVQGQKAAGTFNYKLETSTDRNDTSYMAWCCQALKAAKIARLEAEMPGLEMAVKKAVVGLKLNADPHGGFGYVGRGRTGLSGAGAFCLQMLGAASASEVKATLAFLAPATFSFAAWDRQPYESNVSPLYYWYYITQAKFQDGKETFAPWNAQFSPELCRRQIVEKNALQTPDGKPVDVGHWESPAPREHTGGIVQDTCLCTLMLEVYYRYLPSMKELASGPDALAAGPVPGDVAVKVR